MFIGHSSHSLMIRLVSKSACRVRQPKFNNLCTKTALFSPSSATIIFCGVLATNTLSEMAQLMMERIKSTSSLSSSSSSSCASFFLPQLIDDRSIHHQQQQQQQQDDFNIWFAVPKKKVTRSKKRMKTTAQKRIPLKKNIVFDPRTGEVTLKHKLPFNWKEYLPKIE